MRVDRGALALIGVYLLVLPLLFRPVVHGVDPIGYYAWVRTAIVDHDLDITDEFAHYTATTPVFERDFFQRGVLTALGTQHNPWPSGSALLWSPLYGLAHLAVLGGLFGAIPADGYSWPYPVAAGLSSTLYGLVAVVIAYRLAREFLTPFVAGVATFTIWFATPLAFYMFSNPLMSHANDAFACTLFIYAWRRFDTTPTVRRGLALGAAAGLALWVRTQNGAFLAIPLAFIAYDGVRALRRGADVRPFIRQAVSVGAGFGLLFLPLMGFWKLAYGEWLINTYRIVPVNTIDWRSPHMIDVLISSNRGMFIWAPITLVALAGLVWLYCINRRLTLLLAAMFAIQLYIIGAVPVWSGAVAFGPRYWSNMLALFTLGLGAIFARLERAPRWTLAAASVAFVGWNSLLLVQYALQTVPRAGPVDLGALVRNQFLIIPHNLERILTALMERQ